ncbi:hypothetical protein MtrunA17_Chr2g0304311 [Medicago truncatula]|uniref:Uncharacterized protein n=1 Tax=Medicago truncatula TaxID=3880 RepID=A0A396JCC9_MEDTR|nr:hypothetical protein MtrunA17_Chr2g0304311 [Medicago truncatula]
MKMIRTRKNEAKYGRMRSNVQVSCYKVILEPSHMKVQVRVMMLMRMGEYDLCPLHYFLCHILINLM